MAQRKQGPLPEGLRAEDMESDLEFAAETLSGDIRDTLLAQVKTMRIPWALLNEAEQGEKIEAFGLCGQKVVRQVVEAVVRAGFPSMIVTLGGFSVDAVAKIKLSATPSIDNVMKLAAHGKGAAVLVLAEGGEFYGERRSAAEKKTD